MSFQDRLSASMKATSTGLPGDPLDWGRVMDRAKRSRTMFMAVTATVTVVVIAVAVTSAILLTRDQKPSPVPPSESPSPSPSLEVAAECSASGMGDSITDQPQLPPAVADTRRMILELAVACDYEGLRALTDPKRFAFTFAGARNPARYWQRLEKQDVDVMADLVTVLSLEPLRRNQLNDYSWPRANRSNPSAADWQAVVDSGLYKQRDVRAMQEFTSYIGWRIAINFHGEWIYFISGD
jgi:hypothetical protein